MKKQKYAKSVLFLKYFINENLEVVFFTGSIFVPKTSVRDYRTVFVWLYV